MLELPENAKVILESREYVLARLLKGNGKIEYVTWFKGVRDVCLGHYFDDYESAYKDFLKRSNKINERY